MNDGLKMGLTIRHRKEIERQLKKEFVVKRNAITIYESQRGLTGRGESRSRRPEIHINNIVKQTDKHAQYTDTNQTTSQDGTDPVDGRVTRPAKPEHGDDQGNARDDAKLETFFGLWGVGSNFLGVAQESGFDNGEETVRIVLISGWVEKE